LTGDAETIVMRGKRKHVCDFTFTLAFTLEISQQNNGNKNEEGMEIVGNTVVGNLLIQDFSSDGDYEPSFTISNKGGASEKDIVAVKTELKRRVHRQLLCFIQELKTKV
jgi:hypothetical protein